MLGLAELLTESDQIPDLVGVASDGRRIRLILMLIRTTLSLALVADSLGLATQGYQVDRFAGRYALGKNLPAVDKKSGFSFNRVDSGEVRVLGGACSEVLGGKNLANLLRPGYELESRAMAALEAGEPADVLSIHTSAGVPEQMDNFLNSIEKHLPTWAREENDWAVNLQAEGASAVHAAIDMCLQVYQPGADFNAPGAKTLVACGASSYHGPASTSPGGATPLGARAKGLTHPARYPVPSPFWRHRGEDDASFHGRLLTEFKQYLDTYEHEIGVLLVEPQWGSSVAGQPWPPLLLKAYIEEARSRGIAVVSDEIMCGLGRHGAEPSWRYRLLPCRVLGSQAGCCHLWEVDWRRRWPSPLRRGPAHWRIEDAVGRVCVCVCVCVCRPRVPCSMARPSSISSRAGGRPCVRLATRSRPSPRSSTRRPTAR